MADKLLQEYAAEIEELVLIPSRGGRFEVVRDGTVLFSKAALNRHADPNEVIKAIRSGQPVTK